MILIVSMQPLSRTPRTDSHRKEGAQQWWTDAHIPAVPPPTCGGYFEGVFNGGTDGGGLEDCFDGGGGFTSETTDGFGLFGEDFQAGVDCGFEILVSYSS